MSSGLTRLLNPLLGIHPVSIKSAAKKPKAIRAPIFGITIADKNLLSLFDLLVKYGMSTPKKVAGLTYKKYACQAWSKNSYTILPNGDISKCAESYNRVIGNVWDGVINQEEYAFWINNTLNDSCTECIYLPICQGGCKASFFSRMPQCFALKPIFNDLLIWYVKHMDSRIYLQNQNKI